ncbi:MAG: hypothetical protein WEB04_01700 [Dehalococcoidia bacterium]
MSKSLVSKFVIAAPLIAVAVLALVMAWGHSFSNQAEAVGTASVELVVTDAVGGSCNAAACDVIKGGTFNLAVNVTASAPGYSAYQTEVTYPAGLLKYKPTAAAADESVWGPGNGVLELRSPAAPTGQEGIVNHASSSQVLPPRPQAATLGSILVLEINCTAVDSGPHTITLVPFTVANNNASGLDVSNGSPSKIVPVSDSIDINCIQTPTNTPPPPTVTPPDFPQMQKLCAAKGAPNASTGSAQCNLFLTRQSIAKIPPLTCGGGTNAATIQERLSIPIPDLPEPKGDDFDGDTIVDRQQLGAFEFEVHFDEDKVCVNLVPGAAAATMLCVVEDKDSSQLEGVARIGCVTLGKAEYPDTTTKDGRHLADIVVRPQPDEYSVIRPNQDNGNVIQLNNVGCELADLQGHPIPVFSCEDADVTIRFLEGDVAPDCAVNALDTQAIAFRWGVNKGSTIYTDFMNLEPSGTQADDDIDIKDLQFVFGRFGSTCKVPWPAQLPINAKA